MISVVFYIFSYFASTFFQYVVIDFTTRELNLKTTKLQVSFFRPRSYLFFFLLNSHSFSWMKMTVFIQKRKCCSSMDSPAPLKKRRIENSSLEHSSIENFPLERSFIENSTFENSPLELVLVEDSSLGNSSFENSSLENFLIENSSFENYKITS